MVFLRRYLQSLLGCTYFFLGGCLRRRHRRLLYQLSIHFGFEPAEPLLPRPVPAVTLDEIVPPPACPVLYELDGANGNVSVAELVTIASLVKQAAPLTCFEIGTFDGRTTVNLAANAAPNARVFTLDLPPTELDRAALPLEADDRKYITKEQSGTRFAGTLFASQITQLFGDSATFQYAEYEGKMDLVFVDGSHSYEYVRSDTRIALRLLKPEGGIILWHDYASAAWPGVTQALNEFFQQDQIFFSLRHIQNTTLCVLKIAPQARA